MLVILLPKLLYFRDDPYIGIKLLTLLLADFLHPVTVVIHGLEKIRTANLLVHIADNTQEHFLTALVYFLLDALKESCIILLSFHNCQMLSFV